MKRFYLILCLLFLAVVAIEAQAWMLIGSGSTVASEASYLINQNFEGAGYDNSESWTETAGNPDEDYTTTALRGSQSLYLQGGGTIEFFLSPTFADASTLWTHFMVQSSDYTPSDSYNLLEIRNNSTIVARLYLVNTGYFRIYHGTVNVTSSTHLSDATTYHVWLKYVVGSGSDGEVELYISETTTRGEIDKSISNGDATADANNLYFKGRYGDFIIDHVLADDAEIGNVDN